MKRHFDLYVWQRFSQRRRGVGMAQQQLVKKVDIKFQQILKYETGINWVSASHLWDISEVMDVPVGSLFGGLKPADSDKSLYNDLLGDKKHWIWYGFITPCQKVNADGCLI